MSVQSASAMVHLQNGAPMRQLLLDLGPDAIPDIEAFLPGDNAEVLAWLRAWPALDGALSPLYLWGPSGVGKTHLLRAMVERALALGFGVVWVNAQTCQMWSSHQPDAPTLALIDDCERLDPDAQHLAFKLFIESAAAAAQADAPPLFIFAAGQLPSVDLPVRDDLRTRLGWGLSFALQPLDESGLRQALRQEADRRGMALSDDVLVHLLTRHQRDLSSLMGMLDRLDRYALSTHRVVTVPLIKQMLATEPA
jgi:DnaA family protein